LVITEPATILALPSLSACSPCLATSSASSFLPRPTFVASIPARAKKFVSVGPGMRIVIVTPVSFSSSWSASAKDCRNDFEPLYTDW
jgi:hypothetical protein